MRRKHTILVVDDEPDVVKSVQDLLRLDYNVLGATRAVDGLKIMEQQEVHVVMSDQRMPEMSGVEFLHHIRGEHPEAIRLLFTGYADIRAVIDAINQGNVYRYITKPWDPDELLSLIREAVERYDLIVERNALLTELQTKNKELEQANLGLLQANELKSAFIRVASHELRTPLTIMLGLSHLAKQAPNVPEPLNDWMRRIHAAAERLQRLVDQVVAMLAAGRFEMPLNRQKLDLRRVLQDGVEDVRLFADMRSQVLSTEFSGDLCEICIDEAKIRDCINHLLLNAIKFTADGGSIVVSARRTEPGRVEIRVSDNGVGIDSACLPRLFEPFFTGFDVTHHSSGHFEYNRKGIGLGLSVVKAFVEMHAGRISVNSEKGKGTTVLIDLPTCEPGATPAGAAAAAPEAEKPATAN